MATAAIDASAQGNTEIIPAPGAGKFIRVFGYVLTSAGTVSATFVSGDDGDLTGPMPMVAGTSIHTEYEDGLFDCGVNEALNINLSGAVAVGGHLKYGIR